MRARHGHTAIGLAMRIAARTRLSVRVLMNEFGLSRAQAYRYLNEWCATFGVRAPGEVNPNGYGLFSGECLDREYRRGELRS